MSVLPGETHDSNRGTPKQRRGVLAMVPALTLLLPNYKAKHRSRGAGIVLKYEIHYLQNRWYVVGRPRYRKIMQRLGLRK